MNTVSKTLKTAKAFKLQFDKLGYAYAYGGYITTDRGVYRNLLRSGKVKQTSSGRTIDRDFQVNKIYQSFFNNDTHLISNWSYKQLVRYTCCEFKTGHYGKYLHSVSNRLLSLGLFEKYDIGSGVLLVDVLHGCKFFYEPDTNELFRLVNGKKVRYNVKY